MSFYARVFSVAEDFPSLFAICDELLEEGFEFATSPGKNEPEFEEESWSKLVLQYNETQAPIELERNTLVLNADMFNDEKGEFLEVLRAMPYSKGQKRAVEIMKNLKQIYAFELDENLTEEGWSFLECMLDFICDATDGYVQIDEEGIYDKEGNLMVEME